MEIEQLTNEQFINLYLEYCNDFITTEAFGEYYNIGYEETMHIIDKGRALINGK